MCALIGAEQKIALWRVRPRITGVNMTSGFRV